MCFLKKESKFFKFPRFPAKFQIAVALLSRNNRRFLKKSGPNVTKNLYFSENAKYTPLLNLFNRRIKD